ncbi:MAG: hypothetical protein P1U68_10550 [Verrucomicrobiales bacterium]|nr:hypothetical protein [Verrucomicrobiales bacterium]
MAVKRLICVCLILAVGIALCAQETIKKEIDVSFADLEEVRPILEGILSPAGKFVLLSQKGSVLVIDTPAGIAAAEAALAAADFDEPSVALGFRFVNGLPTKRTQITVGQEVPLPVEYVPPTILVRPYGGYTFIPAVPTRFETQGFEFFSDTAHSISPDGSITIDTTVENRSLDGFSDYGVAVFSSGGVGVIPVTGAVENPVFFAGYIRAGAMPLPIVSTTRVSTSIVIRPRVEPGKVNLDMIPRLRIRGENTAGEPQYDPVEIDLRQFKTTLIVNDKKVGRAYGFTGAGDEFNNRFFGARDPYAGRSAVMVKVEIGPPLEKIPVKEITGTPQVISSPSFPVE